MDSAAQLVLLQTSDALFAVSLRFSSVETQPGSYIQLFWTCFMALSFPLSMDGRMSVFGVMKKEGILDCSFMGSSPREGSKGVVSTTGLSSAVGLCPAVGCPSITDLPADPAADSYIGYFEALHKALKAKRITRIIIQLLFCSLVYTIWKHRNDIIFRAVKSCKHAMKTYLFKVAIDIAYARKERLNEDEKKLMANWKIKLDGLSCLYMLMLCVIERGQSSLQVSYYSELAHPGLVRQILGFVDFG
ncbi:hypothetical protein AKJ16_DCAP15251 [Drosera capensis]